MEFTDKHVQGLKDLLYKMADDLLIIGHRNSEWTGLGPVLEEDIAFSSMAQDKVGQSLALYEILHQLGESDPDTVAFTRNAPQFHCSQLVELPIGEYDFSLVQLLSKKIANTKTKTFFMVLVFFFKLRINGILIQFFPTACSCINHYWY
jgi:phenylacetate-CoA oxygenase PaaI subunit